MRYILKSKVIQKLMQIDKMLEDSNRLVSGVIFIGIIYLLSYLYEISIEGGNIIAGMVFLFIMLIIILVLITIIILNLKYGEKNDHKNKWINIITLLIGLYGVGILICLMYLTLT